MKKCRKCCTLTCAKTWLGIYLGTVLRSQDWNRLLLQVLSRYKAMRDFFRWTCSSVQYCIYIHSPNRSICRDSGVLFVEAEEVRAAPVRICVPVLSCCKNVYKVKIISPKLKRSRWSRKGLQKNIIVLSTFSSQPGSGLPWPPQPPVPPLPPMCRRCPAAESRCDPIFPFCCGLETSVRNRRPAIRLTTSNPDFQGNYY